MISMCSSFLLLLCGVGGKNYEKVSILTWFSYLVLKAMIFESLIFGGDVTFAPQFLGGPNGPKMSQIQIFSAINPIVSCFFVCGNVI